MRRIITTVIVIIVANLVVLFAVKVMNMDIMAARFSVLIGVLTGIHHDLIYKEDK
jgi:hypothetical protein